VIRVLSGAVLIAFAVAVVWFATPPLFEAVAFALLFMATGELIALCRAGHIPVPRWPATIASLLTLATFSGIVSPIAPQLTTDAMLMAEMLALAIVAMVVWRAGNGNANAAGTVSASLLPSLYLALPIGSMIFIREQGGPKPLFLVMLTVIVSDTAQFYTGRLFGRRLLAPTISPKKTIEGAVGGLICGTALFAAVGAWWLPIVPVGVRIAIGLALVTVGIAGDLFESMLKRSVGAKDSSAIIPGHGGVLDRIDALLFAAPLFYLVGTFIRQ
jgi:phosphatidate cytidylyltransferase